MINILISKTTDNLDLLKSKLDIAQNPCDKFFNDSEIPPKFVQIASNYQNISHVTFADEYVYLVINTKGNSDTELFNDVYLSFRITP